MNDEQIKKITCDIIEVISKGNHLKEEASFKVTYSDIPRLEQELFNLLKEKT